MLRMGPFNEERQLARKASVLQVLQQDNLSEWARSHWGNVFDTITLDEARYNDRVKSIYGSMKQETLIDIIE